VGQASLSALGIHQRETAESGTESSIGRLRTLIAYFQLQRLTDHRVTKVATATGTNRGPTCVPDTLQSSRWGAKGLYLGATLECIRIELKGGEGCPNGNIDAEVL
jgi:hypothetical protein